MHCWGDLALTASLSYVGRSVPYYLTQVAAILLEDAVIALAQMLSIRGGRWAKAVGYVWVMCWGAMSGGLMLDWMLPWGVGKSVGTLPFSVVRTFGPNFL